VRLLVEGEFRPVGGIVGAGFEEIRWPRTVRPGDELQVESEVLEMRPSKKHLSLHHANRIRSNNTMDDTSSAAYLYVLEGTLTAQFAEDGSRKECKADQAFLQARTKRHRGRNDGKVPMRFLALFCGAKDVPNVLHPPQVWIPNNSATKR
jgi:mannose-6-phosphate isomerase-like protein (cupin superfamily)